MAVFGLCFYLLTSLAVAGLGLIQVGRAQDVIDYQRTPRPLEEIDLGYGPEKLQERDDLIGLGQVVLVVGLLVAAITFVRWFHQAYRNADRLDPRSRRFATGWAIGGWLVPVLCLWRPRQIANDLAVAVGRRVELDALLGWWWMLWLMHLLTVGVLTVFTAAGDAEAAKSVDILHLAVNALAVVPVAAAILLVRRITVAYALRARPGAISWKVDRRDAV